MTLGTGCASERHRTVREISAPRLVCDQSEIDTELYRETALVKEYVAACEFMYTRVHCTKADGCYPAPTRPPCIGDLQCFEEDPVTLQWVLKEKDEVAVR